VATVPLYKHCRRVGSVYQNPDDQTLHTWVEDEVAFALQNLGHDRALIHRRIDEALDWVGLSGFRHRTVHELSGGQRQRVALAAVCAPLPSLLLLDEPVSQLDPAGTAAILSTIQDLRNRHSLTILFVDHRTESAMPFTERVIVLVEGSKVGDVLWREVCRDPKVLSKYGVEVSDLLEVAERLGCCDPIHRPDDLARWMVQRESGGGGGVPSLSKGSRHAGRAKPLESPLAALGDQVLVCRGVGYRYSKRYPPALCDVSLAFREGESVAVIGENGSGKTTLLMILAGVFRPQGGVIERPLPCGPRGFFSAIVAQNSDLMLQADSVADEIAFGLRCRGVPEDIIRRRVGNALESFRLAEFADDPPFALSQGQRQRVAIASAFALSPQALFLDEPTTGQDRRHIDLCMTAVRKHYVANGGCLVFCTHDLRTAVHYADRTLVLKEGRVLADGPVMDVISREETVLSAGHFLPPLAEVSRALGGPLTLTANQFLEIHGSR
jgi:energy-coupling factor transport system ATP-binding protein